MKDKLSRVLAILVAAYKILALVLTIIAVWREIHNATQPDMANTKRGKKRK